MNEILSDPWVMWFMPHSRWAAKKGQDGIFRDGYYFKPISSDKWECQIEKVEKKMGVKQ